MSFGLSRRLWVVEAGIFLNMLGYGAVFPFEIIYLHEGRGFSLGVAGLVVGLITGVAIFVAPVAGTVIDRVGARSTAVGAGVALAGGYGALAFATIPAPAFAAAVLVGVGNGGLQPSQSALMAALAPRESLQAPAACRASRPTSASALVPRWAVSSPAPGSTASWCCSWPTPRPTSSTC
jgi:MFS family permease